MSARQGARKQAKDTAIARSILHGSGRTLTKKMVVSKHIQGDPNTYVLELGEFGSDCEGENVL